jgi:hypothetical protein
MWDCGPYADLYEPLDYDYEDIDEGLRQPMEFAHNNIKAFLHDVETAALASGTSKFNFDPPAGGRFRFWLAFRSWRTPESPEIEALIWMPSDRLCQVRHMPATEGRRRTLLLNGESLRWEDAVQVIANQIRESRDMRTS